ncbi:GNAT family N-acetyltransferase [Halarcobacter ebronensis]|nr:GNAT family N-acetyltransferase [Halarcobacter ebronensis]
MGKIEVRKALEEDKEIIWKWWNDETTRKMMKQNEFVPWEDHIKWYENTLKSEKRILLMSLENQNKLGVVRFDFKESNIYEVSINLNPEYRGKGYGKLILKASLNFFLKENQEVKKLFAMFKKINVASKKTFLENGFVLVSKPDMDISGVKKLDMETEEYSELIVNKKEEN